MSTNNKTTKKTVKLNKAGDELVINPKERDQPLVEEKSSTVAMLFGRMNPPTSGHEENINGLKKLADQHKADHIVVASHSSGNEKNPLTPEQKLKHLKRAFPDTNVKLSTKEHPTILHQASELHKQGYKHLIVAGGGDRAKEYHTLLNKYNGVEGKHGLYNFDSINVESTGERKKGVSGTDMRNHVKNNDFDSFRSGLPSKIKNNEKHAKELFDDVHKNLHESCIRMKSAIETVLEAYKRSQINEAHLRDPDTYLRMATQAREQGKVLRASLLTRIAAAIRRKDISTAIALRNDLPGTQE